MFLHFLWLSAIEKFFHFFYVYSAFRWNLLYYEYISVEFYFNCSLKSSGVHLLCCLVLNCVFTAFREISFYCVQVFWEITKFSIFNNLLEWKLFCYAREKERVGKLLQFNIIVYISIREKCKNSIQSQVNFPHLLNFGIFLVFFKYLLFKRIF